MKTYLPFLLLLAGCASTQAPQPVTVELKDDPDAVIEEIAVEIVDDATFGEFAPVEPDRAACFMDGMTVPRDQAATLEWDGRSYSFCTPRCRENFRSDPGKCLSNARHKPIVSSR